MQDQDAFVFAEVDAYANHDLAKKHGVHAYPTVKHFPRQLKEHDAGKKYNMALARQGGELYTGPLQGGPLTVKVASQQWMIDCLRDVRSHCSQFRD